MCYFHGVLLRIRHNGCLQQIAANRFSIPQDFVAILLQGFVRRPRYRLILWRDLIRRHSELEAQAELIAGYAQQVALSMRG